jgi:hypothetical protein
MRDDDEEAEDRRFNRGLDLLRSARWGPDHMNHEAAYAPQQPLVRAARALRGLDDAPASVATGRLVSGAEALMQLAVEAHYPYWANGDESSEYFHDELEEIVSARFDSDVLQHSPRTIFRRIRRDVRDLRGKVDSLMADWDVVERNGHRRRVRYPLVEAVSDAAIGTAIVCVMLAAELDLTHGGRG